MFEARKLGFRSLATLNPLTPTVVVWVQLQSILCQTGLNCHCFNFWQAGTLTLRAEHHSAWMSKIINDGLTRCGSECFVAMTYMATVNVKGLNLYHMSLSIFILKTTAAVTCFLPARRYASAGNRDRNVSVRLSVRPSVTRRYCVKTKKDSGVISSPSGSPKTLVFWRQISSPNSKGFPPNGGFKQGSVGKIQRFFSFKRQYLENGSRYGQSYY